MQKGNLLPSIATLLVFLLVSIPAQADWETLKPKEVVVGGANWALFDEADRFGLHTSVTFNPIASLYDLRPVALAVWADEGQRYFAAGVAKDFKRWDKWSLGGAFHVGYIDQPDGLGHKVEYYSQLHLDYQLSPDFKVRAEVGHISNAGFGEINPGSESFVLSLVYAL